MPDRFAFLLDSSQRRIQREYQSVVVEGNYASFMGRPLSGWDPRWGTVDANNDHQTFVDPITGTLMLTPAPLLQDWEDTSTGIFAKLTPSDVTYGDSAKWSSTGQVMNGLAAKYQWLVDGNAGGSARTVLTNTTWPKNRPFWIDIFIPDWNGAGRAWRLECGWNNSASGSSGVSLRVYASGDIEVWKNGVHVGTGKVEPSQKGANLGLCLIPFRQRDLLILSREGSGFVHTFTDIDEQDEDPTITDAAKFWVNVPEGAAAFELAPIRFPSSGYRASVEINWRRAPEPGETLQFTRPGESVLPFVYLPGYGAQAAAASHVDGSNPATAFVANGSNRSARVRVDLTSDNESTPFVSAIEGYFDSLSAMSPASEIDLIGWCTRARLEVAESASGTQVELSLANPEAIDPGKARGLLSVPNRPFALRLGEKTILDGVTEPVRFVEGVADEVRTLTMEVRDRWKLLENFRFREQVPLDRLELSAAFKTILGIAGWSVDDEVDIPVIGFDIPAGGPNTPSGWNCMVQVGDSAAEWLDRLHESYCGNFYMRIRPTVNGPKFFLKSPDDLGQTPVLTIYDEVESALADGQIGDDRQKADWLTFRGYEEWMDEPQALEVVVTGIDRRLYRPIQAIRRDTARIDPFLAPEDRPDGWLGESRPFGWVDGTLTTQDAVNRACDLLYERMHVPRWFCQWEGQLLLDPETGVPLWPGDVVKLRFLSGDEPDDHDVRIVSFSADLQLEPYEGGSDALCRSATYMAEHLTEEADGLGYRTIAHSVIEMREWSGLAIHSRTVGPSVGEPWAFGLPAGGGPIIRP